MNTTEVREVIKAMRFLERKARGMIEFLEENNTPEKAEFVSMTDIKVDIGHWEYYIAQIIENATIDGASEMVE